MIAKYRDQLYIFVIILILAIWIMCIGSAINASTQLLNNCKLDVVSDLCKAINISPFITTIGNTIGVALTSALSVALGITIVYSRLNRIDMLEQSFGNGVVLVTQVVSIVFLLSLFISLFVVLNIVINRPGVEAYIPALLINSATTFIGVGVGVITAVVAAMRTNTQISSTDLERLERLEHLQRQQQGDIDSILSRLK